ncbi:MAG: anti-sigma regulatory factor [Gemmatimonadales bacterium]
MDTDLLVPIRADGDIITARQAGRQMAATLPFSSSDLTVIAAAISEIARNILVYAVRGEVQLTLVRQNGRQGLTVEARDDGPGIADIGLALQEGYSTSGSLGLGLPGARRLMDEFHIRSERGEGTVVTMRKWAREP